VTDRFVSERYDPAVHDASKFSCGVEKLDGWLREHAHPSSVRGTALTWVWARDGEVIGYYLLAAHKVAREEVPASVGRGGPREIPAVLLAKLALDRRLQGRGLGDVLVADALTRVIAATRNVAARLVVVSALTEGVARFYEALGFTRIPGRLVLVQRIRDIEAALT
jgi:predicted N-acetyltransferase YhbS